MLQLTTTKGYYPSMRNLSTSLQRKTTCNAFSYSYVEQVNNHYKSYQSFMGENHYFIVFIRIMHGGIDLTINNQINGFPWLNIFKISKPIPEKTHYLQTQLTQWSSALPQTCQIICFLELNNTKVTR